MVNGGLSVTKNDENDKDKEKIQTNMSFGENKNLQNNNNNSKENEKNKEIIPNKNFTKQNTINKSVKFSTEKKPEENYNPNNYTNNNNKIITNNNMRGKGKIISEDFLKYLEELSMNDLIYNIENQKVKLKQKYENSDIYICFKKNILYKENKKFISKMINLMVKSFG